MVPNIFNNLAFGKKILPNRRGKNVHKYVKIVHTLQKSILVEPKKKKKILHTKINIYFGKICRYTKKKKKIPQ